MIRRIEIYNFKKFSSAVLEINPIGISILAGGNNSGKSSILHAFAAWEFGKLIIEFQKGHWALISGHRADGIGIGSEDFTPFNIPALKYLWRNLKVIGGYSLKIKCVWENENQCEKFLEIGFAMTQERLFIKATSTNLINEDKIPVVAYLPPFAGITDREQWFSPADRRKLIGQGLAGGILRNTIIELHNNFWAKRTEIKGTKTKIKPSDLSKIEKEDEFCLLNQAVYEIFKARLVPHPFSPIFHNYVKVDIEKGEYKGRRFLKHKNYNARDIMVEGSGFLQWLSVFTFAAAKNIDVLLLDEPDAHLHCSLQSSLIEKLKEISHQSKKQILMATHATELIKKEDVNIVFEVKNSGGKYLTTESQKVALLAGIGTEYSPKITQLQRHKRVLFVENDSDAELLKYWCNSLNLKWPKNLVIWSFANNHKERKQLFLHLKDEIDNLIGISLEDRDNVLYEQTKLSLKDSMNDLIEGNKELRFRRWRRWEIENYLISPETISRITGENIDGINKFITENFGITIHLNDLRTSDSSAPIKPLFELSGKEIIEIIEKKFSITKFEIAKGMMEEEVFADPKTLIGEIIVMCQ